MKRFIVIFIWLIMLLALVVYLVAHSEEINELLHISAKNITLLASLFILTQFINSFRVIILVKKVGIRLNLTEAFCLVNVNTMINYLPLKGGMFAAAIYLKNKHSLSYTHFVSIVIASQLMQFLVVTFTASVFIAVYYFATGIFIAKLFYLFLVLLAVVLIGILFLKWISNRKNIISKWDKVKKAMDGLNVVLNDKILLLKISIINFLSIIIIGARIAVAFKIISFNVPFILPFLAGTAKTIATMLSIVPSGLGIAEMFAGGISKIMESGMHAGVFAASVDRVASAMTLVLIGSVSFIYLYIHKMKKGIKK